VKRDPLNTLYAPAKSVRFAREAAGCRDFHNTLKALARAAADGRLLATVQAMQDHDKTGSPRSLNGSNGRAPQKAGRATFRGCRDHLN
jgi:hypothetical protein